MKAVVVRKTPKLSVLVESSPQRLEQLEELDPRAYAAMTAAADSQRASNETVAAALEAVGIEARHLDRAEFQGPAEDEDLVVTVGGDGTMLDASHRVRETPILGFNSDPDRSVGYFWK